MPIQYICTGVVDAPRIWTADGDHVNRSAVLMQVVGLGVTRQAAVHALRWSTERRHPTRVFVVIVGTATLLVHMSKAQKAWIHCHK